MGADLYHRLKRIRTERESAKSQRASAEAATPQTEVPCSGVWTQVAPMVLERRTFHSVPGLWIGNRESLLAGGKLASDQVRFMDTETTGLSGGAGTTVFLIGVGRIAAGEHGEPGVELSQFLLADYPGEATLLERALEILGRQSVWVSYNGKAFDGRMLETRCLMNGIKPPAPVHIDLLYWARRFWSTLLPNCALSSVETHILDRHREHDIPGMEIPERYFAYLESQQTTTLDEVVEHHSRDIVSLAHLFVHIESLIGEKGASQPFDRLQVGRWFLPRRPEVAIPLLEEVVHGGTTSAGFERAAALLVRHYRVTKRRSEALAVASRISKPQTVMLVEELAKFHEHDRRDPETALRVVTRYCESSPEDTEVFARRLERLREKCRVMALARQAR